MEVINHIVLRDGIAYMRSRENLRAEMVARMVVDGEQPVEAVMDHYGLTAGEVYAALAYYFDNRESLDAEYYATLAEIRENAMTLDRLKSKLKR
jgi:uncharacterized protein (DUF433 family)